MCKIDLQDAYFSVSLNLKSKTFLSFKWKDLFYQFLCLCFSFRPAPRIFTKLMRVPISLLRKLYVRLIIFLDDILLMASSKEELTLARNTDISSPESSFFNKQQEFGARTMSEYSIFGYRSQLNRSDTDTSARQKREDCETIPGSTGDVLSLHKELS